MMLLSRRPDYAPGMRRRPFTRVCSVTSPVTSSRRILDRPRCHVVVAGARKEIDQIMTIQQLVALFIYRIKQ